MSQKYLLFTPHVEHADGLSIPYSLDVQSTTARFVVRTKTHWDNGTVTNDIFATYVEGIFPEEDCDDGVSEVDYHHDSVVWSDGWLIPDWSKSVESMDCYLEDVDEWHIWNGSDIVLDIGLNTPLKYCPLSNSVTNSTEIENELSKRADWRNIKSNFKYLEKPLTESQRMFGCMVF
jgi:hypothetical protein